MYITLRLPEVEDFLATATLNEEELTRVKREALRELHQKVVSSQRTKPDTTSDRFVGPDFRKNWERTSLPLGVRAGTDYDYFQEAIQDCINLFGQFGFPGKTDPDRPGYYAFGSLVNGGTYNQMYKVWENGNVVSSYSGLKGPWVDFGPTADYALFLEKSTTTITNNLGAPYYKGIGVLHAIASRLQLKYQGSMRIFAHTQVPGGGGGSDTAVPRSKRKVPIETFPVIRIMHRHYKG